MPWSRIADLPAEVKKAHPTERCQRAFLSAANDALAKGESEEVAFRIGHAAASRCDGGDMNDRIRGR